MSERERGIEARGFAVSHQAPIALEGPAFEAAISRVVAAKIFEDVRADLNRLAASLGKPQNTIVTLADLPRPDTANNSAAHLEAIEPTPTLPSTETI